MKSLAWMAVFVPGVLLSSAALAGASVNESALGICAKIIKDEIGVSRYTTFDKEVGIIRQVDGNIQYFVNASYKSPEMAVAKPFRAVCDGRGFQASVPVVAEGSWSFSTGPSLAQQLAEVP